ncbi:hypothetical protein ABI59_23855 [Acidobacteria bacterium Mor1]|nr:hypothetical protein ABI59_23855 [Acidobacteria bacterium Mor1]
MSFDTLAQKVGALAGAGTPSEVFHKLLDASRVGSSRCAIFLVRQGKVKGWGCVGYEPSLSPRLKEWSDDARNGWVGEVLESGQGLVTKPDGVAAPDFGQPPAGETVALAVRVGGRAVALLLAERGQESTGWNPATLSILGQFAELKLDLDLARRKLRPAQQPSPAANQATANQAAAAQAPAAPAPVNEATAAPATAPTVEADTPAVEVIQPSAETTPRVSAGTNPGIRPEPSAMAPVESKPAEAEENPDQVSAKRYAKLIATDIRLYNEESVMLGRQNGDLAKRIGDHLNRGRETFMRRYSHLGPGGLEILHSAFVQVLAAGNAELLPPAE